mmetsp:Transcript_5823/g.10388  ORF Transcript_5823/g.10388 Transcript_5823/m.10388 type:complete len:321 (+) Transcript_5823:126-1088(+)
MTEEAASGFGEFEYQNGTTYVGHWEVRGGVKKRHGHGKLIHSHTVSGGGKQRNRRDQELGSRGSVRSVTGSLHNEVEEDSVAGSFQEAFEGEWFDDLIQGYGVYNYLTGAVYDGEWHMGKHHGHGTYYFPNGAKYVGYWENHFMHGKGVYTDTNGIVWEGVFINGTYDSTIQKRLKDEFEEKQKIEALTQETATFISEAKARTFTPDKKAWKENILRLLVNAQDEVEKFIMEPYCRFEDRTPDKWNDLLTQLLEIPPQVVKAKDSAIFVPSERICVDQLTGPGQVVEFKRQIENRRIELAIVKTEGGRWAVFHAVDVVQK